MEKELLSPKSDLIFKLIFGDNKNIDILTSFLQSVLDLPQSEYSYLTIVDPNLRIEKIEDKTGILDVKIHTKTGKIIDVEIQIIDVPQMRERVIFYTSKMITEQIGTGDKYSTIKKVISIVILDYRLITENEEYHNVYQLYDKRTNSKFTDILEINTLELPKLPEKKDGTALWNWLRFINADSEEELAMIAQANPQIEKAVVVLKELSNDERTRLLEESREKARRDQRSREDYAFEKGKLNTKIEIVKSALAMNININDIAKLTHLSVEEIEKISTELIDMDSRK